MHNNSNNYYYYYNYLIVIMFSGLTSNNLKPCVLDPTQHFGTQIAIQMGSHWKKKYQIKFSK